MTVEALARVMHEARAIEWEARPSIETDDRDEAQAVIRHAVALRRSVENWIVKRATAQGVDNGR